MSLSHSACELLFKRNNPDILKRFARETINSFVKASKTFAAGFPGSHLQEPVGAFTELLDITTGKLEALETVSYYKDPPAIIW